ncbi:variant erythrocyte surface antigen-1 family protein [Babesia caballi]|uniref:Variant erythrocyte surface antigen-1 family protein n=1 Tax=Babesia caballi TaxID=5871 RepID=A0AAV4LQT3_BABCB|nr:variant erythrocyte surface antigen-1 family protein [Babesia caballi]
MAPPPSSTLGHTSASLVRLTRGELWFLRRRYNVLNLFPDTPHPPLSSSLSDCPSNLKEAIDWILRVTGKDGQSGVGGGNETKLAEAVVGLRDFKTAIGKAIEDVKNNADGLNVTNVPEALKKLNNQNGLGSIIGELSDGLGSFIGYESNGTINGKGIGNSKNYTASAAYKKDSADWSKVEDTKDKEKCAKIFLGTIPLIMSGLSYMYWRCSAQGKWNTLKLDGSDVGKRGVDKVDFQWFMMNQGFHHIYLDGNKNGSEIVGTPFQKLKDFSTVKNKSSYYEFFAELHSKPPENLNSQDKALTKLYYAAKCYFQFCHMKKASQITRSPSTIRDMLYFLAALPYSPSYTSLETHIETVLRKELQVADSSLRSRSNTITKDNLKDYLTTASCIFSAAVLGTIQKSANGSEDPFLHELFSNGRGLTYPLSGHTLFSTLSSYTYALQFQLSFLYGMCSESGINCDWVNCRFGKDFYPKSADATVPSHICMAYKCTDPLTNCQHKKNHNNSSGCLHNDRNGKGCGDLQNNQSPLQAFLTDNLQGFSLSRSFPSAHMTQHPPGSRCHVKMGFTVDTLRSIRGTGNNINYALYFLCSDATSPLLQLCEKLGCLTKRTPRTLGDLFGFFYHLSGQVFPSGRVEPKGPWMAELPEHTPFSYAVHNKTEVLEKFVGSSQTHSNSHETSDLKSLSNSGCKQPSQTCGPYLAPLTLSNGATFGKSAPYASTYLSWMVYLTDDLETGFQELLHEFKNIDCSKSGCRGKAGGKKCDSPHPPGTHGTNSECQCDSVVHCGGVLPVLYRHGFQFHSPYSLSGGRLGTDNSKRSCDKFHSQLSNVLAESAPLTKLLESIDDFLYLFRFYFFYNQSAFWTIYVCIILYTFFFLLDTLRVRSHLHFPSSHGIPPIGLLTTGKAPALTKFTKLTYFTTELT